jgi:glycosyltransferase involved in cell wall biosynthesis
MAGSFSQRRTILDVSSLARWAGPPDGILRVEHALAAHAMAQRPDIQLAVFDPLTAEFRSLAPAFAGAIVSWDGAIDAASFDDPRRQGALHGWRRPRHALLMALEGWRLRTGPAWLQQAIASLQQSLYFGRGLPAPFSNGKGRRSIVPVGLALERPLALGPGDTVLSVGYDWGNQKPAVIGALRRRLGFRYVVMCHDALALRSPEMLPPHVVSTFRQYWSAMFTDADRILVNSRTVERDIREHCAALGKAPAQISVVKPGCDRPTSPTPRNLPQGLTWQRFILFVGTIESRKGHAMLIDVWERLIADGVIERSGFALVLAGRRGWGVDELMGRLRGHPALGKSLQHLPHADDALLSSLYAGAAFCVFPSRYEGFGLPVIESFAHGKAMIASTGGALPETVNGLSPCLDPDAEQAWYLALRQWIENPTARDVWEKKIRDRFSWPDWNDAAAGMFAAAEAERLS